MKIKHKRYKQDNFTVVLQDDFQMFGVSLVENPVSYLVTIDNDALECYYPSVTGEWKIEEDDDADKVTLTFITD